MVLVEWLALITQFVLFLQAIPTGLTESLIRFFSFFTISTNLLVGIYVTFLLVAPDQQQKGFFLRPGVQTAIVLYILIVGLVYNILLRHLWHAGPIQAIIHDLLHTVMPILVVVYWQRWVDTRQLQYQNIATWLIYPAAYAVYTLVRGAFAAWYPYPFIDAAKLGYERIAVNCAVLAVIIVLFSALLIFWGKKKPFTV